MNPQKAIAKERMLTQIIRELTAEMGITLEVLMSETLLRFGYSGNRRQILRYDWDLNSATAQLLAKDKCATFQLLQQADIPCVEYHLFYSPKHPKHAQSTWNAIFTFAAEHQFKIVGKPNNGTGGNDVLKAASLTQIEQMVDTLFSKYRMICLSPYYEIACEYRVIILDGEAQLVYGKQRPAIKGNGLKSVYELLCETNPSLTLASLDFITDRKIALNYIPQEGEELILGWQHNLGKKSSAKVVEDAVLKAHLIEIAQKTVAEVGIRFASVDIIETERGDFKIMEVNSGVMMEHFASQGAWEYQQAKSIYRLALEKMLDWKPKLRELHYKSLAEVMYA